MRFTVIIAFLCVSTTWAADKVDEEAKEKREAPVSYPSQSQGSQSYHSSPLGHEDANAVSIGAGYSVGNGKPAYSFEALNSGASLQSPSSGLQSNGHATIQLPPITLQPGHGPLVGSDLNQLMSQLSQSLNAGAFAYPSSHGDQMLLQAQGGQELALPQFTYGAPKLQLYSAGDQTYSNAPSYAVGSKGLGTYSSTGPVLFNPADGQVAGPALNYAAQVPSHQFNSDTAGLSFGGLGHSLGGLTIGGGHSFSGLSLGNGANSLSGTYKSLGGNYGSPSKHTFKPSTYLGSSSDSQNAVSSSSGSYSAPTLGAAHTNPSSFSGSHNGFGGGSPKFVSSSYVPVKSEGFGSLDSFNGFGANHHAAAPHKSTYASPSGSYNAASNSAHAASSNSPQFFLTSSKHNLPGLGIGGSSYKSAPSRHSSLDSYSNSPRYNFGGLGGSSHYSSPKDIHGAFSESTYNTIKYSEELKPRIH